MQKQKPTVTFRDVPTTANDAFTAIIEFSEAVEGFELSDILFSEGASLSDFSVVDETNALYSVLVTPTAAFTLSIDAGVATDLAGNGNEAATPVDVLFDNQGPTPTISQETSENDGEIIIRVVFDEAVQGVDQSLLTLTSGVEVVSFVSESDTTYLFTLRAEDIPEITATIAKDRVVDDAGNGNESSNELVITLFIDPDKDDDGIPDDKESDEDADGDDLPNNQDPDSDNDGIPDRFEDGTGKDTDGDGIDDQYDVDQTEGADENGDGIDDDVMPRDTDDDGTPDYLDLDSDNDGLPDALETPLTFNDEDGDGIDDTFDVDQTGGVDANNDGIDDDVMPRDSDGDGLADYLDNDSDNDGITDTFELDILVDSSGAFLDEDADGISDSFDADYSQATEPREDNNNDGIDDNYQLRDTDEDGLADYIDLDSDNDCLNDVFEAGLLDANEDGLVDSGSELASEPSDIDDNGVPDFREANLSACIANDKVVNPEGDDDRDGIQNHYDDELDQYGDMNDRDGDGIPSDKDLDDDGDGIPDVTEGHADTDGDGVINSLDTDSDGDGIDDRTEANLPAPLGEDSDSDGIDDAFDIDQTSTGGDDILSGSAIDEDNNGTDDRLVPENTDDDATPDHLDTDSDNDGIPDSEEGNVDTDNDGLADYRDLDSDNDGVPDANENGDWNKDGINDRLQAERELITKVKGHSAGSADLVLLLILSLFALFRWRKLLPVLLTMGALGVGSTQAAESVCQPEDAFEFSFPECWYVGAGLGIATLNPDDSDTSWDVIGRRNLSAKIHAGYHFKPQWFAEVSYAYLGNATVEHPNPYFGGKQHISYQAYSLYAGYLLRQPTETWNIYLKVGLAGISNKASSDKVDYHQQVDIQLAMSAGVQWHFNPQWFARAGIDGFDRDAYQMMVSISRYFGKKSVIVPVIEPPKDTDGDGIYDAKDQCPNSHPNATVDAEGCDKDTDGDGVIDTKDACPATKPDVKVDEKGCDARITETKAFNLDVKFASASSVIETGGEQAVQALAEFLTAYPVVTVEIEGHTDSQGRAAYNKTLSDARANAVKTMLVQSFDIDPDRITAVGYGEEKPISDNATPEGRKTNRRVVGTVSIDYERTLKR